MTPAAGWRREWRTLCAQIVDHLVARGSVASVDRRERSLAARRVEPFGVLPLHKQTRTRLKSLH